MLSLPKTIKNRIAKEFRFIADKITETESAQVKIYLFSGFHGELQRAINWHWDAGLVLCHQAMQQTHTQMAGRLSAIAKGTERPLGFPEGHFEQVDFVADQFAKIFESADVDESKILEVLTKIAVLGYASTGNGNYLAIKNQLEY